MTVLFTSTFDGNNFNEWTNTATNGTGALITQNVTVHHGAYAAKFTVGNVVTDYAICNKTLASSQTELYCRAPIRFDALPDSDNDLMIPLVLLDNANSVFTGAAFINRVNGNLRWGIEYDYNGPTYDNFVYGSTETINANQWYCMELYVKVGAGNGVVRLWIDGVVKAEATGISNNNYPSQKINLGVQFYPYLPALGAYAVNVYGDCCVAADARIGCETIAMMMRHYDRIHKIIRG